ncbi:guanine-N(7)--methyltransferase subunit trm82 [Xylogone sp. PMI_703]|nr:guanine-N(7)--methyltransferase subunit trm82 [Xylogone sp. PMI_703]
MASLPLPYQCLQICGNVLVAARGASIDILSLETGMLLSTWNYKESTNAGPSTLENDDSAAALTKDEANKTTLDDASPQAKRRRLSSSRSDIRISKGQDERKPVPDLSSSTLSKASSPTIINMTGTRNGKHLVVVTGEDKAIRVLEWESTSSSSRTLSQKSLRTMPKRPCAIAITKDDSTIISADKFGDVYALPLIETKMPSDEQNTATDLNGARDSGLTPESKLYKPAASDLTVHSIRNLKALQNQLRHANRVSEKLEPDFEHHLLLGHVSMLTDLALVTLDSRDYIITADRDEHIRVSRGQPHSHIIEGFCLGHSEFISRLSVPESRPSILISGGGENELFVWDWRLGELIERENLSTHIDALVTDSTPALEVDTASSTATERSRMIAVSSIHHATQMLDGSNRDVIVATCEGVPAIIIFMLTQDNHLEHLKTLNLAGNALSVAVTASSADRLDVFVSIDTIYAPGTTTRIRDGGSALNPLQHFTSIRGEWNSVFQFEVVKGYEVEIEGLGSKGRIKETLYNLEGLRKREGDTQTEE